MGEDMMDEAYALLADLEGPEEAAGSAAYARRTAGCGMISRDEAVERASAYLREQGSYWSAHPEGAQPNPSQGLWIVEHRDPRPHDGEPVMGGSVLVVPSEGPVYEIAYLPDAHDELLGVQSPAEVAGLPSDWSDVLGDYLDASYWWKLVEWMNSERAEHEVYPRPEDVFAAFELTPFDDTRVVILGQDPYPRPGQAHGLCFSVPRGVRKPRSLINIHQVLQTDLQIAAPDHGNLQGWAGQGVLLLNTALTVRHGEPGSHADRWKTFTDAVIQTINNKQEPVVFVLWGEAARAQKKLIDTTRHGIVESAHPTSRPNATDPFRGSKPFSATNQILTETGRAPIDWASADLQP